MKKEVCVETFDEAVLAEKYGANRIELCSDLANDGLTPSFELMQKACARLSIPVMVMIRPRAGNFVYNQAEVKQMKMDIDRAKEAGATGVVFGLLTPGKKIDLEATKLLAEYALPLPVTFHKAIDEMEDPKKGVQDLLSIGNIKRILTSGGKPTAMEGMETLHQMRKLAGDKIIILVAGKVLDTNVDTIQKLSGAQELHGRRIVGELNRE